MSAGEVVDAAWAAADHLHLTSRPEFWLAVLAVVCLLVLHHFAKPGPPLDSEGIPTDTRSPPMDLPAGGMPLDQKPPPDQTTQG